MLKVGLIVSAQPTPSGEFTRDGLLAVFDSLGISYTPLYIDASDQNSLSKIAAGEMAAVGDKYWESDVVINLVDLASDPQDADRPADWLWQDRVLSPRAGPPLIDLGTQADELPGPKPGLAETDSERPPEQLAREVARRAVLNLLSTPAASRRVEDWKVAQEILPPIALFAAAQISASRRPIEGPVVFHLPFSLDAGNEVQCPDRLPALIAGIRAVAPLLFVVNSGAEVAALRSLTSGDEFVYEAATGSMFMAICRQASLVVTCDYYHAAAVAGGGIPVILLATGGLAPDSDLIGIPVMRIPPLPLGTFFERVMQLREDQARESRRLLDERQIALARYRSLIRPILNQIRQPVHEKVAGPLVVWEFSEGWHASESDGHRSWRWAGGSASIIIQTDRPILMRLTGEWNSLALPNTVTLDLPDGDKRLFEIRDPGFNTFTPVEFEAPAGSSVIHIRTSAPPIQPAGDTRSLCVAWGTAAIESVGN